MKKLFLFFSVILVFFTIPDKSFAITDPLNVPNNILGVHILFPAEVQLAAGIVNKNGGDWGYVTIPIQSGDKDIKKWQLFMNACSANHLIPIIRLATEGDYFNTNVWRKPTYADVLDFANFLYSLKWPTQNHYIVVYNEVNRNNEWGGKANAAEYAQLLSYAVTTFKTKSKDFFIISAGMDNAAANSSTAINEYSFFSQMNSAVPGIFNQIDGLDSHSYPNPGFSSSPQIRSRESIDSFSFESDYIDTITSKKLPIFITETGWSRQNLSDSTIANYFLNAFSNVWNDKRIVAVTPFILFAAGKPFSNFSLLASGLSDTPISLALKNMPKIAGKPLMSQSVLASEIKQGDELPLRYFGVEKKNTFLDTMKLLAHVVLQTYAVVK